MSFSEQAMTRHQEICSSTRTGHLSREHEYELYRRGIAIAADGSIVLDGDDVYLLEQPFHSRIDRVDYFHGMVGNSPMAQMMSDADQVARDMLPRKRQGNTVKRITVLQRMWRNRLWRRRTVPDLIQLARGMVKVYAEARQFGWIVPSLDYERKLAERDYSTASKHQRSAEMHHHQRLCWETRHEMSW